MGISDSLSTENGWKTVFLRLIMETERPDHTGIVMNPRNGLVNLLISRRNVMFYFSRKLRFYKVEIEEQDKEET